MRWGTLALSLSLMTIRGYHFKRCLFALLEGVAWGNFCWVACRSSCSWTSHPLTCRVLRHSSARRSWKLTRIWLVILVPIICEIIILPAKQNALTVCSLSLWLIHLLDLEMLSKISGSINVAHFKYGFEKFGLGIVCLTCPPLSFSQSVSCDCLLPFAAFEMATVNTVMANEWESSTR